jgi:hypothetical protein
MTEFVTVFENEEAAKLLNYFICYKHLICNMENENKELTTKHPIEDVTLGLLPEPEELTIK